MRIHRTSWSSLAFGLLFIGVGVLLLTNGVDLATRLDWVGPIFLIVVAFCLIASALADRPRPVPGAPWVAPPPPVADGREPVTPPGDDRAGPAR